MLISSSAFDLHKFIADNNIYLFINIWVRLDSIYITIQKFKVGIIF